MRSIETVGCCTILPGVRLNGGCIITVHRVTLEKLPSTTIDMLHIQTFETFKSKLISNVYTDMSIQNAIINVKK